MTATATSVVTTGANSAVREQPAALFEDPVGAPVELLDGLVHRDVAVHEALGHEANLRGDALPLRHFRRGLGTLQLVAKRPRVNVVDQAALAPRASPRRKVPREVVKTPLHRGLRK